MRGELQGEQKEGGAERGGKREQKGTGREVGGKRGVEKGETDRGFCREGTEQRERGGRR